MKALFSYLSRLMNKPAAAQPTTDGNKTASRLQKPLGKEEWNGQWLGEEMRPFNSMGS